MALAKRVGAIIERQGKRVWLQDWDLKNSNFVERMDTALASGARVIAILSPEYLASENCLAEWMHPLQGDLLNTRGRLVVMRAAPVEPKGLLRNIASWNLVPVLGPGDDARLADLVALALLPDAERRRIAPDHPHWREPKPLIGPGNAIHATASFTGRERHLLDIDSALWSGGPIAAITQPAAVTGLGGIGKSTLAREYAWRAQEGYAGVWWLDASGSGDGLGWEALARGLVDLGATFIPSLADADDLQGAARFTLNLIAHGGFAKPWLLVYDNVDDPGVLSEWQPHGNAHVLVTSRIGGWRGRGPRLAGVASSPPPKRIPPRA